MSSWSLKWKPATLALVAILVGGLVVSLVLVSYDGSDDEPNAEADLSVVFSDRIVGDILLDEGVPTGVIFEPIFTRPGQAGDTLPGDYTLELRDDLGSILRSVPFKILRPVHRIGTPSKFGFSEHVSSLPDYTSVAVMYYGDELGVLHRSKNTPSVFLQSITQGQQFSPRDSVELSWTGSDPDGDDLIYKLYYSTDGGDSYRSLSPPTTDTSGNFELNWIGISRNARIGISVSDGTRSSFTESHVFSAVPIAPRVAIVTPKSSAVFAEGQDIVLEAWSYDPEDESLQSSAFSWISSLNGYLGVGSPLVIGSDDLASGNHTISVTGIDSDDLTATASVNIRIVGSNIFPIANDDEAFGELEESILIDVLANDIDAEGDFDLSTLTIDRHPGQGIAEVVLTEKGDPVINYSPISGGKRTFTYYICDGPNRCDSAEVTVVFPDCTINGTQGDDNLIGTARDDVICGLGGNDTIDGKAGNDIIYAGYGDDLVYGRVGDDTIYGGPGSDTIHGNEGADTIYPGPGNNTLLSD